MVVAGVSWGVLVIIGVLALAHYLFIRPIVIRREKLEADAKEFVELEDCVDGWSLGRQSGIIVIYSKNEKLFSKFWATRERVVLRKKEERARRDWFDWTTREENYFGYGLDKLDRSRGLSGFHPAQLVVLWREVESNRRYVEDEILRRGLFGLARLSSLSGDELDNLIKVLWDNFEQGLTDRNS